MVFTDGNLEIIQDPSFRRLKSTINFDLALKQFGHWTDRREGLKRKLEELNRQKFEEVNNLIRIITFFRFNGCTV